MIKRDQVLYGPLARVRQHPHAWASQQGECATRITRQALDLRYRVPRVHHRRRRARHPDEPLLLPERHHRRGLALRLIVQHHVDPPLPRHPHDAVLIPHIQPYHAHGAGLPALPLLLPNTNGVPANAPPAERSRPNLEAQRFQNAKRGKKIEQSKVECPQRADPNIPADARANEAPYTGQPTGCCAARSDAEEEMKVEK
jgi:hypothetical protein